MECTLQETLLVDLGGLASRSPKDLRQRLKEVERRGIRGLSCGTGDIGLEIAPGNEVEDLSLIEDVGNIWNQVPVAREWTPLDPK